jgi:glucan biosynthesis protein
MQSQAQMAYWQKDSKIGAIKNYNFTYRVLWTLRYTMLLVTF